MNFNDLNPDEKLALILFNKNNIGKMFDTILGIAAYITLFSSVLIGMFFVVYIIKSALGIDLIPDYSLFH